METAIALAMCGGQPAISSVDVANGVQRPHDTIIKIIRRNRSDFEDFGPCGFEIRMAGRPQGGGHPLEVALLTEPQAMLLLTYMRNNEVVRAFKKHLVRAFFEMREQLAKQEAEASKALEKRTNDFVELSRKRVAARTARNLLIELNEVIADTHARLAIYGPMYDIGYDAPEPPPPTERAQEPLTATSSATSWRRRARCSSS